MPRSGVAYEQVVEAAQEVLRDGQSPSVRAVTNILGTGSSTTINKHLRTFWRDLGQSMKAPTLEGMPGDLVKPMRELWDVAKNTALERLAEERTAARAKADQAIERVTEIQQLLETRDKELVAAQDHARALEERITALSESEQALSDRLKAEHDRRARAESDRKAQAERAEIDRGHFQARVDQMAAANERLEERITAQDHSHQARLKEIQERAEAQEEHWLRQLEVVRQEARETLDREVAARHSAEKQTKACQEEIAALRGETQKRETQAAAQLERLQEKLEAREQQARADLEKAESEKQALREEIKALQTRHTKQQEQYTTLARQSERDKLTADQAAERLREAEARIAELERAEK